MQREVRGEGVAGPLDVRAPEAGNGRAGSAGLQRQLTQQREQVKRNQLTHSLTQPQHPRSGCRTATRGGRRGWPSTRSRPRG